MVTIDRRPSRGRTVGYWWITLTAVAIAALAVLPYLTNSLRGLASSGDDEFSAHYAGLPPIGQAGFYLHIVFAGLALLLSPLQFAARLRARAPRLHRLVGRIALTSIVLGGIGGLILAPVNLAGPIGTAGFGLLAVLWVAFAVIAFRAIRRGDVAAHRRWMVRAFALTYAGVMLRVWLGLLTAVLPLVTDLDAEAAFDQAYLITPFLSWVPNLLVAELWLRRSAART